MRERQRERERERERLTHGFTNVLDYETREDWGQNTFPLSGRNKQTNKQRVMTVYKLCKCNHGENVRICKNYHHYCYCCYAL